ncbi:MAG: hypothetical protein SGILL_006478, partial [Bacillariaceae sp.]
MDDIALSFFASACGKNRGAFVLDPPDGQTYGCLNFPTNIAELAGIHETFPPDVVIDNANAIKEQFVGGNTTATETVALLEFLVENVYKSSANLASSPYACEFNGLAKLECSSMKSRSPRSDGSPIRSVSMAGVFTPALWATGGKALSLKQAANFYTLSDFQDMKTMGLNTVQLAVPTAAFIKGDEYGGEVMTVLEGILDDVKSAGLDIIINLVATADELDAVVAAAKYVSKKPVVLALGLPKEMMIDVTTVVESIRAVSPKLSLFVPLDEGDL